MIHLLRGFVMQKKIVKMLPTKSCIQQKIPCPMWIMESNSFPHKLLCSD
jgi:hypothetical protein